MTAKVRIVQQNTFITLCIFCHWNHFKEFVIEENNIANQKIIFIQVFLKYFFVHFKLNKLRTNKVKDVVPCVVD